VSAVVEKGDVIKINYIGRTKDDNKVFDTNIEEVAKAEGLFQENHVYSPLVVVVGNGWIIPGLDEALVGLEEGKPVTIEVPVDKAYGPWDPSKVKIIPKRELQKRNITPVKGQEIQIDGQRGKIIHVAAGRVRVDFNHPYAGKDLIYEITVVKKITDEKEKVLALLERRIPGADFTDTIIEFEDNNKLIKITLPKQISYYQYLPFVKRELALDLKTIFPNLEKVIYLEEISLTDL